MAGHKNNISYVFGHNNLCIFELISHKINNTTTSYIHFQMFDTSFIKLNSFKVLLVKSYCKLQREKINMVTRLLRLKYCMHPFCMSVCVAVLWPSQPIRVMTRAVSLPNHSFPGQA